MHIGLLPKGIMYRILIGDIHVNAKINLRWKEMFYLFLYERQQIEINDDETGLKLHPSIIKLFSVNMLCPAVN